MRPLRNGDSTLLLLAAAQQRDRQEKPQVMAVEEADDEPLQRTCLGACYNRLCYIIPLAAMAVLTLAFFYLCVTDRPLCLALLCVYMIHHAWCYLFHVTVFSLVGQLRIRRAELLNYRELYEDRVAQREAAREAPGPDELFWEDPMHFVILPNYKEDIDILREAIDTLAISTLARNQMGLVLAMEAREPKVQEKAEELLEEYRLKFKYVMATYHPPGLPNEMPGKSSNTRWAAQRLWSFLEKEGLPQERVILTVADADSDFHPVYFEALNYKLCATTDRARREVCIWQAPIMHYKNYHSQPAIVKLCSLFVTQHELANLADESATPLPYSTYSITSNLARKVGGWDPDWISEDWHMFLKCFLNTGGQVSVVPILLPVINYTPEDETWMGTIWARWTQGKRHALGICEMSYYLQNLPHAVQSVEGGCEDVAYLFARGIPIIYKMFAIHIVMATYWIFSTCQGPLIWWVWSHPEEDSLGSWREFWVYLSIYSSIIAFCFFLMLNVMSITLYNGIRDRIVPVPEGSGWDWVYRNPVPHYFFMMFATMFFAPGMNVAGGLAEWLAAIKTAKSHKFEYDVASKPQAAKNLGLK